MMLTREQIRRLARRHTVGMQVQERDLRSLLPQFVAYEDVRRGVTALLEV